MDSNLLRPSKIRKRANKACLACRARKVRCDVSQRGRPCMNCFLDSESCVVVDRASRRRKSAEEDGNGEVSAENASAEHMQRHGSAESSNDLLERGDGDARMETMSDGGSYEPDTLQNAGTAFSAANASSSTRRPAAMSPDRGLQRHSSRFPPQHPNFSTSSRIQNLHWSGEESTVFGSEVTYSYYAFLEVNNLWTLLPQDASYLELQGCLRVPKKTILDEYVKQYFLHVHPIVPLINEGDFWETYGSTPAEQPKPEKISLLVFQAMLFAACAYVSSNTIRALGFSNMKAARAAFYRRAKLLYDFEAESSSIAIAQASLLLSSWSPSAQRHSTQTGSFWLGVAIQQAKLAGAHRYKSLYSSQGANSRHAAALSLRNTIKRLWWCIIVSDRMHSLCAQKPMQVTILHFGHEEMRNTLILTDFADEIERSRVYNSGAKKTLIKIFLQITQLAVVLTDLLGEILPSNEMSRWDDSFRDQETVRIEEYKRKMQSWYKTASLGLLPRSDSLESASQNGASESAPGFSHDSVVLYTNFMWLIYQSAMVRLCHHECFRMSAHARSLGVTGRVLPDKTDLAMKRRELQRAAQGVMVCLKTLTQSRLTRWLPLNSIAYVSLPLCLDIIDVKLPPQSSPNLNVLLDLYDYVKAYQAQQDMTDWMAKAIRHILDLSGLDRLERVVTSTTGSVDSDTLSSTTQNAAEGLHPSLYLRLAVSWIPGGDGHRSLGQQRPPIENSLSRVLGLPLIDRIKSDLNRDSQRKRTSSTRLSVPAPDAADQAMRSRIAAWQAHDQAVSLELGFDPSGLALEEADGGVVSPGSSSAMEAQDGGVSEWRDAAAYRAFSAEGDAHEAELLEPFVFRDQVVGDESIPQFERKKGEHFYAALEQEVHGGLLESVQGGRF